MIVGYRKYLFVSRSFPALALAVFEYAANAVGLSLFVFPENRPAGHVSGA
jgi:hypothetical protein